KSNSGIDLFKGVKEGDFVYFVHSYYVPLHEEYTIAKANFTLDYSAAIHKDNFYATQFHPEKSGMVGQKILENFMAI
ncbi:MAG: imidazole glycerol phosphate synthase subunit HisH, partial [Prevotella sp.]|nr:imidazole glycerol phosphate synthase subunit HisH [Prevotella sp.]